MAEESRLTVERLSALLGISEPDETVRKEGESLWNQSSQR